MEMDGFNLVDAVLAALVLLSAFFAFYRGFVREALSVAGWVGAAVLAYTYFPTAKTWLAGYFAEGILLNIAAAGGVFLGALVVFWLIIHIVSSHVRNSPLNTLDRSLGFLFGVARGVVVIALVFLLGRYSIWDQDEGSPPEWLSGAASYTLIVYSADMVERLIPDDLMRLPPDAPSDLVPLGDRLRRAADAVPDPELLAQPPVAAEEGAIPDYDEDPTRLLDGVADGAGPAPDADAGTGR